MKKKSMAAIIIASIGAASGVAFATKKYMDKKKEKLWLESDSKRFSENLDRPEVEVTTLSRLRSEPSRKAQIIDWVKEGTLLEYVEDLGKWLKVKYQGDIVYISKKDAVR